MAAGNISRIIRAPGRMIVAPTTAFATGTYPYGGTEIGKTNVVAMASRGRPYLVPCEGLGAYNDMLEANHDYVLTCFVRGWDDDAVEQFLAWGHADGATTKHAVFGEPGTVPGTTALGRGLKVAYIPDDPINSNGLIVYNGVPYWNEGAQLLFQRQSELGIPLMLQCFADGSGRYYKTGRIQDLAL